MSTLHSFVASLLFNLPPTFPPPSSHRSSPTFFSPLSLSLLPLDLNSTRFLLPRPYDSTHAIRLMAQWRDEYVTLVQMRVQGVFITSLQSFFDEGGLRLESIPHFYEW